MLRLLAALLFDPAHGQADCASWNTKEFFEAAAGADVERCLNAGSQIEARDENGLTPLHVAANHGTAETVDDLAFAEEVIWDQGGRTPLHMAAIKGTAETVNVLLDAGANIEARAEDGETPLHVAALEGNVETVNALLRAGADPAARDEADETPFDRAIDNEKLKNTDAYRRLNDARFR